MIAIGTKGRLPQGRVDVAARWSPCWAPPRGDKDASHIWRIKDQAFSPVFILELHRSGTTWFYEELSRLLPVATVTTHDVLAYPRLLDLQNRGAMEADRAALDGHFAELGLTDRQIDAVSLSHAMVEEHGWILRGRPGSIQGTLLCSQKYAGSS